ncbi:MAG: biliverdin-producing heme oxygenase [Erythrobacter sp.]
MTAHDLLDRAMHAASGWQTREDYARFLELQHAARAPLEDWLEAHAPKTLHPPRQTQLIAQDLAALGRPIPAPGPLFTLGRTATGQVLGVAWVLAGSALGNRGIAKQVRRISGGTWPMTFLADAAMLGFWQALRARIEQRVDPCEADCATTAARAVFAHFLAVAEQAQAVQAAP